MDWQAEHFTQWAVFNAPRESILAAARAVVAEGLEPAEDTPDGFVARGRSAWHAATATFRVEPAEGGSRLVGELKIARAGWRSYMLVDVGGYYDGQLRRWLADIARLLGQAPIASSQPSLAHGCLAGCVVYILAGAALSICALPLDRLVLLPPSVPLPGPAMLMASSLGLLIGAVAFLWVRYPAAAIWKAFRRGPPGGANPPRP